MFRAEEGDDEHCQVDNVSVGLDALCDWAAEILSQGSGPTDSAGHTAGKGKSSLPATSGRQGTVMVCGLREAIMRRYLVNYRQDLRSKRLQPQVAHPNRRSGQLR